MSMPFDVVYCSRCSLERPTFVDWGIFKYRFPDGSEMYVDREIGWCGKCELTTIESFPQKDTVASKAKEVTNRIQELRAGTLGGYISYFFSRNRCRTIAKLREELSELSRAKRFLGLRKTPRKCLHCGSTEVIFLNITGKEEAPERERFDVPLGFKHPNCGGELNIRDNGGLRIALALTERFYDIDGDLIEERPAD